MHYVKRGSHRLRLGRVSLPGQAYVITCVTRDRRPLFRALRPAREVAIALYSEAVAARALTLAHVVMPDHLHWLMQLRATGSLGTAVRIFKASVSIGLGARIWQAGFHDRALRRDEDLRAAARYVVANPVRAGLVETLADYPHWDAAWLQPGEAEAM